jgi:hypothetical protein
MVAKVQFSIQVAQCWLGGSYTINNKHLFDCMIKYHAAYID